jgi:hypothetical protein
MNAINQTIVELKAALKRVRPFQPRHLCRESVLRAFEGCFVFFGGPSSVGGGGPGGLGVLTIEMHLASMRPKLCGAVRSTPC